jgi:calcium-translocating P-type ATPase
MLNRHIRPHEIAMLEAPDALIRLNAAEKGLSQEERENRLIRFGKNELPRPKRAPLAALFLKQFLSPFVFLLFGVVAIALMTGETKDAVVIGAVLLFNATVGTIYSARASKALRALENQIVVSTRCLRNGSHVTCDVRELVPGDVVVLSAGDRVPADGRWLWASDLRVDESSLTGESVPVDKHADPMALEAAPIAADIKNAGYSGTSVVGGQGRLLVTATGTATEIGTIAAELREARPEPPLIKRVRKLSHQILIALGSVSIILFIVSLLSGQAWTQAIAVILALIVSAVPEGMPIVLTLVLARGVHAMSKRNAIVKELASVEALGGVDLIFTDKTGTLTTNQLRLVEGTLKDGTRLSVRYAEQAGRDGRSVGKVRINGQEATARLFAEGMGAVADVAAWEGGDLLNIDALNLAFTDLPKALGMGAAARHGERPFSSSRRTNAVAITCADGIIRTFMAGAPEAVLQAAGIRPGEYEDAVKEMAARGLRVVGMAMAEGKALERPDGDWTYMGLAGIRDEARPEAAEAVAWCREHRIRVIMVTGDHPETAFAIAEQVGIAERKGQVVLGEELARLTDDALRDALQSTRVIARATPELKMKLVRAARGDGKIIAMTGDGVNDAPALQAADVGIAMGKAGTDVARGAASLILMDDNFATIVAAIREGRSVVANVEKVVTYLLSTSAAEVVVIGTAILFGMASPLLPAQILWLNLVTDGFLDIGLAMEPTHGGHAKPPKNALMPRRAWIRIALLGTTMGLVGWFAYRYTAHINAGTATQFGIVLLTLSVLQWWNAWNARSATASVFKLPLFSNKYLWGALAVVVALMLLALYWPPLAALLSVAPVAFEHWLWILPLGAIVILVDEIWKLIHRRTTRHA